MLGENVHLHNDHQFFSIFFLCLRLIRAFLVFKFRKNDSSLDTAANTKICIRNFSPSLHYFLDAG